MRAFHRLLSAATTTVVGLLLTTTGFADASQPMELTVANHNRLVTVKDGSGAWLFAQVLPSANVTLSVASLGKSQSRVSLRDASGHTLWSRSMHSSLADLPIDGEWDNLDAFDAAMDQALKSLKKKTPSALPPVDLRRIDLTIGPDDRLMSFEAPIGKKTVRVVPLKNGFACTIGNQSIIVLTPPTTQTTSPKVQATAH